MSHLQSENILVLIPLYLIGFSALGWAALLILLLLTVQILRHARIIAK